MKPKHHKDRAVFEALYPTLKGEELREAQQNFDGYLAVVLRIYNRIRQDPEAYRRFKDLTASRKKSTIRTGRRPSDS